MELIGYKLEPCPHCGKSVELMTIQCGYAIVCSDHNCLGGMSIHYGSCDNTEMFLAKLIANWNKRQPEVRAVTAAIECIHDYGEDLYRRCQEPYDEHGQCCINVVEEILNRLNCFTTAAAVDAWIHKGGADHA